MTDDLRSLSIRLAALEDAARAVSAAAPDEAAIAVNPALQQVIEEERIVMEQIRRLRAGTAATTPAGRA
ncbi:hypothetical protein [Flexivirga caeni]|uniref:Uncharacterized protein n=1 Tax=Flexivirga caeni TaxID=2294115 RepID=A0A3M9ME69_9MICO|nr:hypothetical protein [Flexivirga caeni]RNI22908.1 hypothetical protein EFY87_08865 [Flexivirga caeni]